MITDPILLFYLEHEQAYYHLMKEKGTVMGTQHVKCVEWRILLRCLRLGHIRQKILQLQQPYTAHENDITVLFEKNSIQ